MHMVLEELHISSFFKSTKQKTVGKNYLDLMKSNKNGQKKK
jgi:hypothetical protein